MDLEIIATSAVKTSISQTELLSPCINEVDKEPSWDGNIYIYQTKKKKKDGLKKVPVQVKGKLAKNFSAETINYRVNKNDLENYLTDGGVFYFVVYIDSLGEAKNIYYCSLLPVKIRFLLEESKNKKSLNIELRKFPDDNLKKQSILLTFHSNMQKQTSFAHAKLFSLDEFEKQGILESISFSVTGFKNQYSDPKDLMFQDDLYMYANVKGSTIPQPIEGIPINLHMMEDLKCEVSVDGKVYYKTIRRIYSKGETKIQIGNSCNAQFIPAEEKMIVNITPSNMLSSALCDLPFILALNEHRGFEYNGVTVSFDTSKMYSKEKIDSLKNNLKYCQDMKSVLDKLRLNIDVDLENMSAEDKRHTHRLIQALIYDEEVENLKEDIPFAVKVDYLGAKIVLAFNKLRKPGTYRIYDYFNMPFAIYFDDEKQIKHLTSQFEVFKADDFLELSNIDYDAIINSFKSIEEDYIYARANIILLEFLLAYDKSNDTRKDILEAADKLATWLFNIDINEEVFERDIRAINYFQVQKRKRKLKPQEKKDIALIADKQNQPDEMRFAAYLLLGDNSKAKVLHRKMSKKQIETLKEFPIYRYW